MSEIEIWLLAVSLAIDCFTVSVTSGIILKNVYWRTFLTIGIFFGVFQAAMPFIGWICTKSFYQYIEAYDHWIAFALLSFIGIKMIREFFNKDEEQSSFNPQKLTVITTLAIATSIDALAVGISLTLTGFNTMYSLVYPLTAIGVTSFVLSVTGCLIGVFFGRKFKLRMELPGGLILIGIGIKILIEHLS